MAPTEETIVRSFLLQKAGLRDVLTLAEFTSYFPPSKRSSPLIRHLYRDLLTQRNAICESVLKQINLECRLGETLVARKRAAKEILRNSGSTEMGPELETQVLLIIDDRLTLSKLFEQGDTELAVPLDVILAKMRDAVQSLQEDMETVQEKIDDALKQMRKIAGDMSDLRYGTTDQHITEQLKAQTPAGIADCNRNWLQLATNC